MPLSNPVTFTVSPSAVVTRVHRSAMLVGEPHTGDHVLAISAYGTEANVYATFPGQQVGEYQVVKAQDAGQRGRYHGHLLATEAITVRLRATTYDVAEEVVQRREVEVEVDATGWTPYEVEFDFLDAPYFNLDLTFDSATATLYLDTLDLDVKQQIEFNGLPSTFNPYLGLQVEPWGAEVPDWFSPFDPVDVTATIVTLAQAQADDPTMADPGGEDEILRVAFDAYPTGDQWGILAIDSRPVHKGTLLYFEGKHWLPVGMDGVEVRWVLLDEYGNTDWAYTPVVLNAFTDSAAWESDYSVARASADGVMHLMVVGYANGGAGRVYLKDLHLGSDHFEQRYASDLGDSIADWATLAGHTLEPVVRDGIPALRLTGPGPVWRFNLTPEIPAVTAERLVITFDFWVPEGVVQTPTYELQVLIDPIGAHSVAGSLASQIKGPGWNSITITPGGPFTFSDPDIRAITLGIVANGVVSEALIANLSILGVTSGLVPL